MVVENREGYGVSGYDQSMVHRSKRTWVLLTR